jgi:hypothetical protein
MIMTPLISHASAWSSSFVPVALGIVEEKLESGSSKGWAEMIRKVYDIDPGIV